MVCMKKRLDWSLMVSWHGCNCCCLDWTRRSRGSCSCPLSGLLRGCAVRNPTAKKNQTITLHCFKNMHKTKTSLHLDLVYINKYFIYANLLNDSVTHCISVIGPGRPLEMTILYVEWEIFYRNITGGFEHSVAEPDHLPGVGHNHVRIYSCRVILGVRTEKQSSLSLFSYYRYTYCREWRPVARLGRREA